MRHWSIFQLFNSFFSVKKWEMHRIINGNGLAKRTNYNVFNRKVPRYKKNVRGITIKGNLFNTQKYFFFSLAEYNHTVSVETVRFFCFNNMYSSNTMFLLLF